MARAAWRLEEHGQWPPEDRTEPPGREAIVIAAATLGLLMLGIQLWLLTTALDMFLSGQGKEVWQLALTSGLLFLGGLLAVWLLRTQKPPPFR